MDCIFGVPVSIICIGVLIKNNTYPFFIFHHMSARDTNICQRDEGPMAEIDRGLIQCWCNMENKVQVHYKLFNNTPNIKKPFADFTTITSTSIIKQKLQNDVNSIIRTTKQRTRTKSDVLKTLFFSSFINTVIYLQYRDEN